MTSGVILRDWEPNTHQVGTVHALSSHHADDNLGDSSLVQYNETLWPTEEILQPDSAGAPGTVSNPNQIVDLDKNHLFAWCILCSALVMVESNVEHQLPFLDLNGSKAPSTTVIATLCRRCVRNGSGHSGPSHLAVETFWTKQLYTDFCKIACRAVVVSTDAGQNIRFASIEYISASLPADCILLGLNFTPGGHKRQYRHHLDLSSCFCFLKYICF